MLHNALIAIHAISGVLAFGFGMYAIVHNPEENHGAFRAYMVSLLVLTLSMAAAIGVDWTGISDVTRIIYLALFVLAAFMIWRGRQAGNLLKETGHSWHPAFIEHIGFGLISLFDGFVIVLSIDLGAPVWMVVLLAVAAVIVGNHYIGTGRRNDAR